MVRKRVFAAALIAALALGLTSCADPMEENVSLYIQGELDATYLGKVDPAYVEVVEDLTEEEAQEKYANNLAAEAEFLLAFLGVEMPTEAVSQRAAELAGEIYTHARYTVSEAERLKNGDITAEVTVSPIEVLYLVTQETSDAVLAAVIEESGLSEEELMFLSEEDYQALDEQYAMGMLDALEEQLPNLTYGKDQTILLQMTQDGDGYYALETNGLQMLDTVMIDYSGQYME